MSLINRFKANNIRNISNITNIIIYYNSFNNSNINKTHNANSNNRDNNRGNNRNTIYNSYILKRDVEEISGECEGRRVWKGMDDGLKIREREGGR